MPINLDYLPHLSEDFEVDRTDAPQVAEISIIRYKYSYPNGRKVNRKKVVQVFGIDHQRGVLYGCHTIEEEKDSEIFNFIGGDQSSLLKIPLEKIIEYRSLK